MYDDLMENDPEMIKFREKWKAEGLAKREVGEISKVEMEVF